MNGPFIHSPASSANLMSAMGQNMCLDEGGDSDPAEEKENSKTKRWISALVNCDHSESIKGLLFNL